METLALILALSEALILTDAETDADAETTVVFS